MRLLAHSSSRILRSLLRNKAMENAFAAIQGGQLTISEEACHAINLKYVQRYRSASSCAQNPQSDAPPSENVMKLVDEISGLTLLEVSDLVDVLRTKLDVKEMPIMTMMVPGMPIPAAMAAAAAAGGAVKPSTDGSPATTAAEAVKEKSMFNVKLEGYDAASKIKIIKEVRAFTDLGLKEAKELVEKTPALLKKAVTKDEGEQIIAKLKELGAQVLLE